MLTKLEQSRNTEVSIVVILLGKEMLVRFVQRIKVLFIIRVMPLGMVIFLKLSH